ncbi:hypothetical protein DF115_35270 [Burkholderia stagnalis]|nr:hypothetical protein DF031_34675 [Burkholderia stagnalis]RQY06712.1 hypothetical protein DF115_35270 [Burkholderia stagnalis]
MASLVLSSARYTYYPRPRTRLQVSSMRQFLFTGRLCWRLIWFSTGSNFRAQGYPVEWSTETRCSAIVSSR